MTALDENLDVVTSRAITGNTTSTMENEYISALATSGFSVIPITEGAKNPHFVCLDKEKKHKLLCTRASLEKVEAWTTAGVRSWGIAGGKVSDNLVTLDFDEKHYIGLYDLWYDKLSDDQREVVNSCYRNSTRNNGVHLRYRTQTPQPTIKLARKVEYNKKVNKEEIVTIAETRGEGAYALIPPSVGYVTLGGDLLKLPIIPDEIHEELIDVLRTFNEVEEEPATEYEWKASDTVSGDRPGDRLNKLATWNEILEPHGWVEESKNHWRRPGKEKGEGISATTNYEDRPMFFVFSSSASPFQQNKGYSKFHVFSILNHGRNFKESARVASEKYPSDKENLKSIEEIGKMLERIPNDTSKVKLMEVLDPIFRELVHIEKITSEAFIIYNIKEHFSIPKEDAKKYIKRLNALRAEFYKKTKEKKSDKNLPLIFDRDINSQEVFDAILEVGIINIETLKIIIAIVISSQLRLNPPLWLFVIGVPSSFKTEMVGLFGAMEQVFTLDTLTENAFASGFLPMDGSEPQDLLPLLDNKCFIIKDLNTIFSMNEEMVKKILGDLTSIFDGKFEKFTATRGMIEYNSLFSMIGCITPSILIKHYNYATQLGPRFLFLRLPELTEDEMQTGFDKSWDESNRDGKIIKTRQLVSSYCAQLIKKIKDHKSDPTTREIRNKINNIARFISKARGIAITSKSTFKNDKGDQVEFYEIKDWQVEHPWRILNQLKSLLKILSFVNGKSLITQEEINIIRPIILSTMPVDRAEILSILAIKCGISSKELAKEIGKSTKTIQRTMKELEALKIVDCYKDPNMNSGGKAPWLFFLIPEFASILNAPTPSQECMSQSKSNIEISEQDNSDDEDVDIPF